jgi:hypothetical protein
MFGVGPRRRRRAAISGFAGVVLRCEETSKVVSENTIEPPIMPQHGGICGDASEDDAQSK